MIKLTNRYRINFKKNESFLTFLLRCGIAIIIIGILFKIQHWPYGKELLVTGFTIILIGYPFQFYKNPVKSIKSISLLVLIECWFINALLISYHLPYRIILQILVAASFSVWLALEIKDLFQNKEQLKQFVSEKLLYILAAIGIMIGLVFKIQHWPYSDFIILISLGIALIVFIRQKQV